jgi:hypothetical protein
MPPWWSKAAIQGTLSVLPRSSDLNYLFQRHVSGGLKPNPRNFEEKLATARGHLERWTSRRKSLPQTVLELGTGWQPIVPVALALCGIPQVLTIDITPLTRTNLVRETLTLFADYADSGKLAAHIPVKPERLPLIRAALAALDFSYIPAVLSMLGVTLKVGDARRLDLPAASVDYFVSNSVFEHIAPEILSGILHEFRRVAAPKALMSHLVDLSDHYAHFDRRITSYHFLRYSRSSWRWFNNSLLYQSRQRAPDYLRQMQSAGFSVLDAQRQHAASQPDVIHADFAEYSPEDLAVTWLWMVCATA